MLQVGSYQQYWGGVSGGVEGNESLLHRALQEVRHSTGTAAASAAACTGAASRSVAACTGAAAGGVAWGTAASRTNPDAGLLSVAEDCVKDPVGQVVCRCHCNVCYGRSLSSHLYCSCCYHPPTPLPPTSFSPPPLTSSQPPSPPPAPQPPPQISEEVGLSPQQLQLVTCGRPLPVDDGGRHFLVYPFLFNLLQPAAAVTLNWENVAYDWLAARWG
jgi:hypothetical protein